jgi:8-oxo-dGTP diphosphatase
LLVRKIYGNGWDIPGGYAETGESPAAACQRELKEELGIQREVQRLLVVDWAPHIDEGDKILYVFDCGELGDDENRIQLASDELDQWEWVPVRDLPDYVIPRLALRLTGAHPRLLGRNAGLPRTRPASSSALGELGATRCPDLFRRPCPGRLLGGGRI